MFVRVFSFFSLKVKILPFLDKDWHKWKVFYANNAKILTKTSKKILVIFGDISMKKKQCKFWSSRTEVFCKKGAFRQFAKFIGKHLCQRLFLIKLQALAGQLLLLIEEMKPNPEALRANTWWVLSPIMIEKSKKWFRYTLI